ncbi:MauE/DoxX family redox-associated membrane protein [Amycolatopsis orientalis]|uniref:MauE/DoxX family redox-associated membrane protein n=1 Tax=Amycolatopsis orientalis TaxID=31958 RepID=UPI00040CE303|nr:MauE/DoxX family redox-associated membrane protein [Amycolatopsis orientalis]
MSYVVFGCRCALIVVFAVSAISKSRNRTSFAAFRRATIELVPAARGHGTPLAAAVVAAEFVIVVGLAVPDTATAGLLAAGALVTAFTVAIATALHRGVTASCRCFGGSSTPVGARHLVRNAVLIVLAVLAFVLPGHDGDGNDLAALGLAAVAGVVVALLVISFDALADLFLGMPPPPPHHEGIPS